MYPYIVLHAVVIYLYTDYLCDYLSDQYLIVTDRTYQAGVRCCITLLFRHISGHLPAHI